MFFNRSIRFFRFRRRCKNVPNIDFELKRFLHTFYNRFVRRTWSLNARYIILFSSAGFTFQNSGVYDEELLTTQGASTIESVPHKILAAEEWEHVYESDHIKVLRRKRKDSDLYEFRCFGSYNDISPNDFIDAQFDVNYRLSWDENISSLKVLEEEKGMDSQLLKWVAHFPYPMYPRLYIFVTRKIVDEDERRIIMVSSALDQKTYPDSDDKNYVRVANYKSKLIVWAHKGFDDDGLNYLLTYYDDPKSSMPTFAYNIIVNHLGPSFMDRVHTASKVLKANRERDSVASPSEKPGTAENL